MKGKKKSSLLDKSLVLAGLPFWGYSIAYVFEVGYLSFFNLPNYLIRLSIENVIVTTFILTLLISVYSFLIAEYIIFPIVLPGILNKQNPIDYSFRIIIAIYFIIYLPFLALSTNSDITQFITSSIFILITLLVYYFLFPIFLYKNKKISYQNKVAELTKEDNRIITFMDFLLSQQALKYTLGLLLIIVSLMLSFAIGKKYASIKSDFLIFTKDHKDFAIVQMYQNDKIGVEIDVKNKKIKKSFLILNNNSDNVFVLKSVGVLKSE